MHIVDRIAKEYPDNVMLTSFPLHTRADVEQAFVGSGMVIDPSCRVRYLDAGLLATFRAGLDDSDMQPWFAIAWGTLREDERETWLLHWHALEK